jgi:hypothetical protein
MNIPQIGEHSYYPRKFARFNNANVNVQQGCNSATNVTISPEALEAAKALGAAKNEPNSIMERIKLWQYEVHVEAYKNGTSFKVAMEEHGMEIAEFFSNAVYKGDRMLFERLDSEEAEEFLDGIAKYMNGQTFEEAFGETFNRDDYDMTKVRTSPIERGYQTFFGDPEGKFKYVHSWRLNRVVCQLVEDEAKPDIINKEDGSDKIQQHKKAVVESISEQVLEQLNVRNVRPNSRHSAKNAKESVGINQETKKPLGKSYAEEPAESVIFKALDGKVNDAKKVAKHLRDMIFSLSDSDLQMRAENREAARNLAGYIAENYLYNPEEAQTFMAQINKYIENSESRDKGGHKELFVEFDMYAEESFAQKTINNAKLITDFSGNEKWNSVMDLLTAKANAPGTIENCIFNALDGKVDNAANVAIQLANMIFDPRQLSENREGENWALIFTDSEEWEARAANREAGRDLVNYIAENFIDDPEEAEKFIEQMEKYIKNSELQDQDHAIDNAEKITDFSDNEKWNFVMNLLRKA